MDNRPSRAYLRSLQARYRRARKKAKGVILDEFTQTTGGNRDYAIRLLRGDYTYTTQPIRHPRARYYTAEDGAALEHISELLDWMCSKLLRAEIPLVLPGLREEGTLDISDTCAQHLLEMSPATMGGLLRRPAPSTALRPLRFARGSSTSLRSAQGAGLLAMTSTQDF